MGIVPGAALTTEYVVRGVEDNACVDLRSGASNICCAGGIDGKGKRWIQLAVVNAMERRGIDDPVRRVFTHDARHPNTVRDIDITVTEADGIVPEHFHQVLPKLTGGADDEHLHAVAPAA